MGLFFICNRKKNGLRSFIATFFSESQVKVQRLGFQHHRQVEDTLHGAKKRFIFFLSKGLPLILQQIDGLS